MRHDKGVITVEQACFRVGKNRNTIVRWCHRYGIGKQVEDGMPWRIDPIALDMVNHGDRLALWAYHQGEMHNPAVLAYLEPQEETILGSGA